MISVIKNFFIKKKRKESSAVRWVLFALIWIPCLLVFLNLYPGTLSTDTPRQMSEAIGQEHFTNYNPFVNTALVAIFVRLGILLGDINLGVAFYTIFQSALYAAVTSYVVYMFYVKGFVWFVVLLNLAFYAVNPINLIYSVGMWKDTFFSVVFLACSICIFKCMVGDKKWNLLSMIEVFLLVLLTSLTRNSSWTALLIFAVVLIIIDIRKKRFLKGLAGGVGLCTLLGAVASIVVMSAVYPIFGISNVSASRALSLQVQQIARTVQDDELTDAEAEKIMFLLKKGKTLEDVVSEYDPETIDPLKEVFDFNKISDNQGAFWNTFFSLMVKHSKAYLDAFVDHTSLYYWPKKPRWIWDNRIFDNEFGIERSSKLLSNHDIGGDLYELLKKIPGFIVITSSASSLWLIIICMIINSLEKKKQRNVLYLPPLIIIVGLILFSYASLFRYTYVAFILKPMYILYLFAELKE